MSRSAEAVHRLPYPLPTGGHTATRLGIVVAGLLALATRQVGHGGLAVVAVVGAAAAIAPSSNEGGGSFPAWTWIGAVAVGTASVMAAALALGWAPVPFAPAAALAAMVAGVAEEAFFRRLVYGILARQGALVAIAGAALAFAAVHLPMYGWEAAPLNLAAGVLLGWQRWATGGWSAPAVTHVAANLLQFV
jgi:membrane protease YdiL (CAAX protease family)